MIDAIDGITEQDLKLADRIIDEGRAAVIVVNKWDAVDKDSYTIYEYKIRVFSRLYFMEWSPIIFVSAMTGQRVKKVLSLVKSSAEEHRRRVSTAVVNEILQEAVSWHSPPTTRQGKQGKFIMELRYRVNPYYGFICQ